MKRTTGDKAMETREKIVRAAYDVSAEYGYEKSSLGKIANELGITRPALYYHFKSKEDLFLAVYNSIDPVADLDISELLESSDAIHYRHCLEDLLRGVVSHFRSDVKRARFIAHIEHAAAYLPSVTEAAHAQDMRLRETLSAALQHGMELNALQGECDLHAAVEYLAVVIYGISEIMARGNAVDINSILNHVFDGLF